MLALIAVREMPRKDGSKATDRFCLHRGGRNKTFNKFGPVSNRNGSISGNQIKRHHVSNSASLEQRRFVVATGRLSRKTLALSDHSLIFFFLVLYWQSSKMRSTPRK